MRRVSTNVYFPDIPYTQAQLGEEMVISPAFDSGDGTWANGTTLNFRLFSNDTPETPFTYTINNLRFNLNGTTEFVPTGGGTVTTDINTGIPETVNGLNLNQFYGVDDGET